MALGLGATALAGWWAVQAAPVGWRVAVYLLSFAVAMAFLSPEERTWLLRPLRAAAARRAGR
jgi:hypothetical protein